MKKKLNEKKRNERKKIQFNNNTGVVVKNVFLF